MKSKPPYSALAGVIVGILLTVAYNIFSEDVGTKNDNSHDPSRIAQIEQRLLDLQQQNPNSKLDTSTNEEIAKLKQQMSEILLKLESNEGAENVDVDGLSDSETVRIPFIEDPEERNRLAIEREMELRNTLQYNFMNDDVEDIEWAQGTQNKIEDAFQNDKLLGSSLVSSTCKSTMCKLEISPDLSTVDGDMAMYQNELLVALAGSLNSSVLRVEQNDDGSPRIVGYFGKQGRSITRKRSIEGSGTQ